MCINALITSLLFQATPEHMRMILIDPKRVELTGYNGLPHLALPVLVESHQAAAALRWAVAEMDRALQDVLGRGRAQHRRLQRQGDPEARPAAALHRHRHRRAGRPDDGRGRRDRRAHLPHRAAGACSRHPSHHRHAAAFHRHHHRPDQGEHPVAASPSRSVRRSTAASSSTPAAPRSCSVAATCSTSPSMRESRAVCRAHS